MCCVGLYACMRLTLKVADWQTQLSADPGAASLTGAATSSPLGWLALTGLSYGPWRSCALVPWCFELDTRARTLAPLHGLLFFFQKDSRSMPEGVHC